MAAEADRTGLDHDEPSLAAELLVGLRELEVPISVAPLRDNTVLTDAERVLARRRVFANRKMHVLVAAAVLALVGAGVWIATRPASTAGDSKRLAADVDADGRVDIVDAMVLAADVRAGRRGAGADVNGDGVIDERDVEAVAHLAVRVNRGGA